MDTLKALIDIGSNSVRLAIFAGGRIVYKEKITSQLGRGLDGSGFIVDTSMQRTLAAMDEFILKATDSGVTKDNIFAFATATVRRAENGKEFCDLVYQKHGVKVDVVSEKGEADLAIEGALGKNDGAVLDVGGASSELIIRDNGKIIYSRSLPLGAVVLHDKFGSDLAAADKFIKEQVAFYGDLPKIKKLTCVGGTATTIATVLYLTGVGDGENVSRSDLEKLNGYFATFPTDGLVQMGIDELRATILPVGALLVTAIVDHAGADGFMATHNDNLIGYYRLKVEGGENVDG